MGHVFRFRCSPRIEVNIYSEEPVIFFRFFKNDLEVPFDRFLLKNVDFIAKLAKQNLYHPKRFKKFPKNVFFIGNLTGNSNIPPYTGPNCFLNMVFNERSLTNFDFLRFFSTIHSLVARAVEENKISYFYVKAYKFLRRMRLAATF